MYFEGQHDTRKRLIETYAKENESLETKIQELERQLGIYKGCVKNIESERLVAPEDGYVYPFEN